MKVHYWLSIAAIALASCLSAQLAVGLLRLGIAEASPVWPPAGIGLAALLLYGPKMWVGIALGMFGFALRSGAPLPVAALAGMSNAVGAIAGMAMLQWAGFRSFRSLPDALKFLILAVSLSPIVNATLNTLNTCINGLTPWAQFGRNWWTVWLGDGMGILVVTPLLLLWLGKPLPPLLSLKAVLDLWRRYPHLRRRAIEAIFGATLLIAASLTVFGCTTDNKIAHYPLEYVTFPFIIWAALRFGQRGTILSSLLISGIAIWGAVQQGGPFLAKTGGDVREALYLLQAFVGITTIMALVLAAAVTERQIVEERLRRSESSLLNAQRIAQVGNWDMDMPSWHDHKPCDRTIADQSAYLRWSDELYRILGFLPGTLPPSPETFLNAVHPDDRATVLHAMEQAMQTRSPYKLDYRILLPNGTERLISEQVEIGTTGITGTVQDITEHRQAEVALRISEEQFRSMFEGAAIGIGLDNLQGQIVKSNPALQQMLGYSHDELSRMNFAEFTHPEDLTVDQQLFEEMIAGQRDSYQMEKRHICKDGKQLWVRLTNSLVRDGAGNPKFTIGMVEDITNLKRAEESIQLYAHIVKSMQIGLLVWQLQDPNDLHSFRLVDINPAAQQILQVNADPAALLGLPMTEVLPCLLDSAFPGIYAAVIRTGVERDLGEVCYNDALRKGIYATKAFPLPNRCVGLVFEDISDRKQAELALQQSEARFRTVAETATCAFLVYQGTRLRYVNPAAEVITEYSNDELMAVDFWELAHPDFRDLVKQRGLARQQGQAVPTRYEIKILTKSGKERWVDFTAGTIYFEGKPAALATAYDITDRKQAEAQIRMAADRERLLTEIALKIRRSLDLNEIFNTTVAEVRQFLQADRVFITQIVRSGRAQTIAEAVDPQWQSMMNWVLEPEQTQEMRTLFEPDPAEWNLGVRRLRVVNDTEQIVQTPFLEEYYHQSQVRAGMGVPIVISGQLFGVLIVNQCSAPRQWQPFEIDLLKQLATQVEIAIQQGQLYQQVQTFAARLEEQVEERTAELHQRMQELHSSNQDKDLLLHAVSHDLRTPVQGMLMVLSRLRRKCDDSIPIAGSTLDRMIESCDQQLQLLSSLREKHSGDQQKISLTCEPTHLQHILHASLTHLEPLLTQNQAIVQNQLPADLPPVKADPIQIQQVLEHLITNAVKHNKPARTITIHATVRDVQALSPRQSDSQALPSSVLYCTVVDDGVGISQAKRDRLFQLYVRGMDNCHLTGIGLGLHRCRQIIVAHGGQIGCDKDCESGASFWFTLPLKSSDIH